MGPPPVMTGLAVPRDVRDRTQLVQRADQAERARRRAVARCGGRLERGGAERQHAEDEHDQDVRAQLHAVLGAHCGARRSRIGRCTAAAARASAIESHHIASYAPCRS